ncbi:MAG: hypothetical protein WDW36_003886 [Sanguina aurantia]
MSAGAAETSFKQEPVLQLLAQQAASTGSPMYDLDDGEGGEECHRQGVCTALQLQPQAMPQPPPFAAAPQPEVLEAAAAPESPVYDLGDGEGEESGAGGDATALLQLQSNELAAAAAAAESWRDSAAAAAAAEAEATTREIAQGCGATATASLQPKPNQSAATVQHLDRAGDGCEGATTAASQALLYESAEPGSPMYDLDDGEAGPEDDATGAVQLLQPSLAAAAAAGSPADGLSRDGDAAGMLQQLCDADTAVRHSLESVVQPQLQQQTQQQRLQQQQRQQHQPQQQLGKNAGDVLTTQQQQQQQQQQQPDAAAVAPGSPVYDMDDGEADCDEAAAPVSPMYDLGSENGEIREVWGGPHAPAEQQQQQQLDSLPGVSSDVGDGLVPPGVSSDPTRSPSRCIAPAGDDDTFIYSPPRETYLDPQQLQLELLLQPPQPPSPPQGSPPPKQDPHYIPVQHLRPVSVDTAEASRVQGYGGTLMPAPPPRLQDPPPAGAAAVFGMPPGGAKQQQQQQQRYPGRGDGWSAGGRAFDAGRGRGGGRVSGRHPPPNHPPHDEQFGERRRPGRRHDSPGGSLDLQRGQTAGAGDSHRHDPPGHRDPSDGNVTRAGAAVTVVARDSHRVDSNDRHAGRVPTGSAAAGPPSVPPNMLRGALARPGGELDSRGAAAAAAAAASGGGHGGAVSVGRESSCSSSQEAGITGQGDRAASKGHSEGGGQVLLSRKRCRDDGGEPLLLEEGERLARPQSLRDAAPLGQRPPEKPRQVHEQREHDVQDRDQGPLQVGNGSRHGCEAVDPRLKDDWVRAADPSSPLDRESRVYEMSLVTFLEMKMRQGHPHVFLSSLKPANMDVPDSIMGRLKARPCAFLTRAHGPSRKPLFEVVTLFDPEAKGRLSVGLSPHCKEVIMHSARTLDQRSRPPERQHTDTEQQLSTSSHGHSNSRSMSPHQPHLNSQPAHSDKEQQQQKEVDKSGKMQLQLQVVSRTGRLLTTTSDANGHQQLEAVNSSRQQDQRLADSSGKQQQQMQQQTDFGGKQRQQQQQQQQREATSSATHDIEHKHRSHGPSQPSLSQTALRVQLQLWAQLDAHTLRIAQWLRSRNLQGRSVDIRELRDNLEYPAGLRDLMAPHSLFTYRADLFAYNVCETSPRVFHAQLGLTRRGEAWVLGREAPDVSPKHQQAISDFINSGGMKMERKADLARLLGRVPREARESVQDALMQFFGRLQGPVLLRELLAEQLPEALVRWLRLEFRDVRWLLTQMLSKTFVMYMELDPSTGQLESYVADYVAI